VSLAVITVILVALLFVLRKLHRRKTKTVSPKATKEEAPDTSKYIAVPHGTPPVAGPPRTELPESMNVAQAIEYQDEWVRERK
jgi:hypothetical protein